MILVLPLMVQAAQEAQIQLAVTTPDPVIAGGDVTYQIVVINTGAKKWDKNSLSASIEIFDRKSRFIKKGGTVFIPQDVNSGESAMLLVKDFVPNNYKGNYFFKVLLRHGAETILVSSMYPFSVGVLEEGKEEWTYGGNAIISNKIESRDYDSDTQEDTSEYKGNISVNSLGNMPLGAAVFNLSAYQTEKEFDLYSIYASVSGQRSTLELGDVMPYFSELALSGQSGRGAYGSYALGRFNMGLATVKTVDKEEGTESTNGTFARYLMGLNSTVSVGDSIGIGVSGVGAFDHLGSIDKPGEGNRAVRNSLVCGFINWNDMGFAFAGEYAMSTSWDEDEYDVYASTSDNAFSTALSYESKKFRLGGRYYMIQPDFKSPGSPGVNSDRMGYEGVLNVQPLSWVTLIYSRSAFNDNLDNLPASQMVTTNQQIDSGGINLSFSGKWPSMRFNISNNRAKSDPADSLDNTTLTMGGSVSYSCLKHLVTLGAAVSDFKDNTDYSPDLRTNSSSINYSVDLLKKINMSCGYSYNNTKNLLDESESVTGSLSIGMTLRVIPDKLSVVLYSAFIDRESDSLTSPAETSDRRYSAETTYRLNRNFSFTAGLNFSLYEDAVESANDYVNNNALIKAQYSF